MCEMGPGQRQSPHTEYLQVQLEVGTTLDGGDLSLSMYGVPMDPWVRRQLPNAQRRPISRIACIARFPVTLNHPNAIARVRVGDVPSLVPVMYGVAAVLGRSARV
jgi:hypothetical protein